MKRFYSLVAGLVLGLGTVSGSVGAAAEVGKPAPDFKLEASDGKQYGLAEHKGEFVVLEWFNAGCPFVQKHYDSKNMQKLQETYLHKGVTWFSILSSAPGKEGAMTREQATKYRIDKKVRSTATLLDPDGKVGKLYGAKTTPHMYVINKKGVLIYAGAIDDNNSPDPSVIPQSKNYVVAALDAAMAGKPVATPATQPYGCSVKYK